MAKQPGHRIRHMESRISELRIGLMNTEYFLYHATQVAAIVVSGQPRIDEPLANAWDRTLQRYGIIIKEPDSCRDQIIAPRRLLRLVIDPRDQMNDVEQAAEFTKIFRDAPVWLLQFTAIVRDAALLKFQLPDLSRKLRWGSLGYQDFCRWPLLPLGTMDSGDPIPRLDARRLVIALHCVNTPAELDLSGDVDAFENDTITDPLV
jgi:hypothetical protein